MTYLEDTSTLSGVTCTISIESENLASSHLAIGPWWRRGHQDRNIPAENLSPPAIMIIYWDMEGLKYEVELDEMYRSMSKDRVLFFYFGWLAGWLVGSVCRVYSLFPEDG
jgi:hypothetical protein